MELLAAAGGGAFVVVCLVLGVRLLALAARTREIPEFVCGLGLLLLGGIGYPLLAIIQETPLPNGVKMVLLVAQMFCHVVGDTAFCFFTYRVFRPGSRWGLGLTAATFAAILTLMAIQIATPGLAAFVAEGAGIWGRHGAAATIPLLWAGIESIRYHRVMRRRQKLGLADPLITERFKLWAIGMLSAASITVVSVTAESLGTTLVNTPLGGLVIGTLGIATASAVWLAFLPPAAYVRWLSSRSPEAAAAD
jgi:hypothetical protein